jgi:hypothetical protein
VGWRLGSEPRGLSPWPPLPLIWHCATGAHQPRWIGCPRSGRGQRVRIGRWANSVEIYSNKNEYVCYLPCLVGCNFAASKIFLQFIYSKINPCST